MHNSIPEYASTAGISIVMTMSFQVKPFGKNFLKKRFSPQISSKTLESSRDRTYIKRREKEKEKFQESIQIKGKSIF
jgi:hypothetical protein